MACGSSPLEALLRRAALGGSPGWYLLRGWAWLRFDQQWSTTIDPRVTRSGGNRRLSILQIRHIGLVRAGAATHRPDAISAPAAPARRGHLWARPLRTSG